MTACCTRICAFRTILNLEACSIRVKQHGQYKRSCKYIRSLSLHLHQSLKGVHKRLHLCRIQRLPHSGRGPKKRVEGLVVQAVHAQTASGAHVLASFPALVIAACTALVFLAAVLICISLVLRPLLKVSSRATLLTDLPCICAFQ